MWHRHVSPKQQKKETEGISWSWCKKTESTHLTPQTNCDHMVVQALVLFSTVTALLTFLPTMMSFFSGILRQSL